MGKNTAGFCDGRGRGRPWNGGFTDRIRSLFLPCPQCGNVCSQQLEIFDVRLGRLDLT